MVKSGPGSGTPGYPRGVFFSNETTEGAAGRRTTIEALAGRESRFYFSPPKKNMTCRTHYYI
ncbi:MAG: hypothetical protein D6714_08200 [Bacteroidetes bacterium]|nr:MAG: hypothetical protein D6714_08200 [Bacteroidota bacterium]